MFSSRRGEDAKAETEELENVSEASFATATSQGYRTEEDEETSAFEVSMTQWQNDELIFDRWHWDTDRVPRQTGGIVGRSGDVCG